MPPKDHLRSPRGADAQHRENRGTPGSRLLSMGPLLIVIGALACNTPLQRCASDSECSAPEWCDPSVKVCVHYARPQGGGDNGGPADAAGTSDAGEDSDSGVTSDGGGTRDAGGTSDGGETRDAGGAPDAGGASDAGTPNADGGGGPTLAITTPASDGKCGTSCEGALVSAKDTQVVFSGSVTDPAGLSGPLKVSVTRAGATVVTDTAQFSSGTWSWTWDTSGLTDDGAAYTFVVAATNTLGQTTTVARTVWVDRQAPSQTTRLPAPNTADVWPLAPIQLTFSERLLPSSVGDSAVTVLSNGAITVSKRLSLSPDGRTLAIKLLTPPTAGGQLQVTFAAGGLTDLLGNALTSPSTPWQWSVAPIWVDLAQLSGMSNKIQYNVCSVTGTDSGAVLVTLLKLSITSGSVVALSVYDVDARAWTWRGDPPSSMTGNLLGALMSLGADSTPYVAAISSSGAPTVERGTNDGGTTWSPLGTFAAPIVSSFLVPLDENPLVAWGATAGSVQVSRWSGVEWTSMGSPSPPGSTTSAVAMGLGAGRVPLAGWVSTTGTSSNLVVNAWNGSGWTPLGQSGGLQRDPSANIGAPVLGVNSKGQPVAVWAEFVSSGRRVFVSTLENGTTWRQTELNPPCFGTYVLDPEDGIIDVCADTTSRWDGLEWIPLGNTLPVATSQTGVQVGATSRGWPAVVWTENNGSATTFKARRFNR